MNSFFCSMTWNYSQEKWKPNVGVSDSMCVVYKWTLKRCFVIGSGNNHYIPRLAFDTVFLLVRNCHFTKREKEKMLLHDSFLPFFSSRLFYDLFSHKEWTYSIHYKKIHDTPPLTQSTLFPFFQFLPLYFSFSFKNRQEKK